MSVTERIVVLVAAVALVQAVVAAIAWQVYKRLPASEREAVADMTLVAVVRAVLRALRS